MELNDLLLPILCQAHHQWKSFKYSDSKSLCKNQTLWCRKAWEAVWFHKLLQFTFYFGACWFWWENLIPVYASKNGAASSLVLLWEFWKFSFYLFMDLPIPSFQLSVCSSTLILQDHVCVGGGRKKHLTLLLAFSSHRILRNQRQNNTGMTWVNITQILIALWLLGSHF